MNIVTKGAIAQAAADAAAHVKSKAKDAHANPLVRMMTPFLAAAEIHQERKYGCVVPENTPAIAADLFKRESSRLVF